MGSDTYDRLIDQFRGIERRWRPTGGNNGLTSGIVSVMSGVGFSGIQRIMSELHSVSRVRNVLNAIDDSFPAAFNEITRKLRGISIDSIRPILRDMLTDVALYLGGSTALGAGIGGGVGAFAFGAGAVPGAIVGGWLGFEIGNILMALTGLKSVVVFMKDAVPAAISCYGRGFKKAWGEPTDTAPWKFSASGDFARGHVLFLMALLMGIVAYLTRGKGDYGALLAEIRASKKLGPKMAEWLEANKNDLLKNPQLQPMASTGGGAGEALPEPPAANRPSPDRSPPRPSGPLGVWKRVNEAMSDRARAYQTQITGHTDEAYVVKGVKFDGISDDGVLLDAKGPGYDNFVDEDGNFEAWYQGKASFLKQARDQLTAANGNPIEWHFADESAADATQVLFDQNSIPITVIHTPPLN